MEDLEIPLATEHVLIRQPLECSQLLNVDNVQIAGRTQMRVEAKVLELWVPLSAKSRMICLWALALDVACFTSS